MEGDHRRAHSERSTDARSSQVASHPTVYGVSTSASLTFSASGNATQILALYAPNYIAKLNGTVDATGAFIVKSLSVNGGGNGGFHYDESLGKGGLISGWDVASNFEETRGDL